VQTKCRAFNIKPEVTHNNQCAFRI